MRESTYEKFRSEIAAGGAATDRTEGTQGPWSLLGLAAIAALLILLGMVNIWMLVFVVGILISIFLHEWGHYWTARRTGMKVTQFFMGFGPRIWSFHRNGIEYGLRAVPAGAFVRIIGMNNLDEVAPEDEQYAYRNQTYPRRMLVITAGSIMHILIAVVLLVGVYAISGRPQETGRVVVDAPPVAGSPASIAGLQEGDVLLAIGGEAVTSRDEFVSAVQSHEPGDAVVVRYERDGQVDEIEVGLGNHPELPGVAYLGVQSLSRGYVQQSLPSAMVHSVGDLASTGWQSIKGVAVALNPVNMWEHVAGTSDDPTTRPTTLVGASQAGGIMGEEEGLKAVLLLLAGVNVFVGIFNMFPVLPLDGGHAAIATYERVRSRHGRRYYADVSKMVPVATLVVVLLLSLFVTGLYLDITDPIGR